MISLNMIDDTVDGRNPAPVDGYSSFSHYSLGFMTVLYIPGGCLGFSSINSTSGWNMETH